MCNLYQHHFSRCPRQRESIRCQCGYSTLSKGIFPITPMITIDNAATAGTSHIQIVCLDKA